MTEQEGRGGYAYLDPQASVNAYKNAVISVDDTLRYFWDHLDPSLRENSLFVFYSDHGEKLMDREAPFGEHGYYHPYQDQTNVLLAYKFPGLQPDQVHYEKKVGSLMDIFPTLFDVLGLYQDKPFKTLANLLFYGRSIFDRDPRCYFSVRPNGGKLPEIMALSTTEKKYFFHMKRTPDDPNVKLTLLEKLTLQDEKAVGGPSLAKEFEVCWKQMQGQ